MQFPHLHFPFYLVKCFNCFTYHAFFFDTFPDLYPTLNNFFLLQLKPASSAVISLFFFHFIFVLLPSFILWIFPESSPAGTLSVCLYQFPWDLYGYCRNTSRCVEPYKSTSVLNNIGARIASWWHKLAASPGYGFREARSVVKGEYYLGRSVISRKRKYWDYSDHKV